MYENSRLFDSGPPIGAYTFGGNVWFHVNHYPNFFIRTMQKLILGITWKKL